MEEIPLSNRLRKVLAKEQKKLEKNLQVELTFEKDNVIISGEAFPEYIASKVLRAIDFGFDVESALLLSGEDYMLEIINLKSYVRPSRLKQVKGRIIGEKGRAKKVISELTECDMVIKDNTVALLGRTENITLASKAVRLLISGSPHASVYTFLEKNMAKQRKKFFEE